MENLDDQTFVLKCVNFINNNKKTNQKYKKDKYQNYMMKIRKSSFEPHDHWYS